MAGPVVSVITTVYNGERFLAESIDSVLAQQDVDFELVIVDDGSIDGTGDVLDRVLDPRVLVLRRPRLGRAGALNEAVSHSRGAYLAVHDADDRCLPGRLSLPVRHLDGHPDIDLVGSGQWVVIDEHGSELGRRAGAGATDDEIRRLLRSHHAPFAHSSVTMRRSALDRVGGYDEDLLIDVDLDLYVRVAAQGRLATVPEPLVAIRRHDRQYFAGRQGRTRQFRRRVVNRRVIDRRAHGLLGGTVWSPRGTAASTLRELGAWAYWRGRRLAGARPVLPVALRHRLDRRWSR